MNKIALPIGHKESSQGAINKDSGTTEWEWNGRFVFDIDFELTMNTSNIESKIFHRTTTIRDLVKRINEWNPDLCIEFHCNSYKEKWIDRLMRFEKEASGTEILLSKVWKKTGSYWKTKSFPRDCFGLSYQITEAIGTKIRASKYRGRYHPKGGYFLNKTKCKAIIAETFFIDCNSDLAKANENYDALVQVYVDWIVNYFKER